MYIFLTNVIHLIELHVNSNKKISMRNYIKKKEYKGKQGINPFLLIN